MKYLVTEDEFKSATINENGDLLFTRDNGEEVNAGRVKGDEGAPGPAGPNTVPTYEAIGQALTEDGPVKDELNATIGEVVENTVPTGVVTSLRIGNLVALFDGEPLPTDLPDGSLVIRPVLPGGNWHTDFAEYPVDALPSDWSLPWEAAEWEVVDRSGVNVLTRPVMTGTARRGILWQTPDVADENRVEVLTHWSTPTGTEFPGIRVLLRATGVSSGTATAIVAGMSSTGGVNFYKYENGAASNGPGSASIGSLVPGAQYALRAQIEGGVGRVRGWLASDPEPTSWQVTWDAGITSPGLVGLVHISGPEIDIHDFSVATGGRVAGGA